MTELELYKFIKYYNIEWHKYEKPALNVIIFVPIKYLTAFHNIMDSSFFDEEGIACTMKDGYFAFWMRNICEYHGIEIEKVFTGEGY